MSSYGWGSLFLLTSELSSLARVAQAPKGLLSSTGLVFSAPPFCFRVVSRSRPLAEAFFSAYPDYELLANSAFVDFDLELNPVKGLRRFFRPLISLKFDGDSPFDPLPAAQAFPLLEWGLNWCVTSSAHQYLMFHSAVLAKGDVAVLLPAPPGSGKSTLCAALMLSGWRLLSDELALIDPQSGRVVPFVRPVSLKNDSIALIGERFPSAVLTQSVVDTVKGTVAHLRPSVASIACARAKARPRFLVFPQFSRGSPLLVERLRSAEATVELARNAFNLPVLGALGFHALAAVGRECQSFVLRYERLDQAISWFDHLIGPVLGDHAANKSAR